MDFVRGMKMMNKALSRTLISIGILASTGLAYAISEPIQPIAPASGVDLAQVELGKIKCAVFFQSMIDGGTKMKHP